MPGDGLTAPGAGAAGQVDAYLDEVAARLVGPARERNRILAELRDGLWTALDAGLAGGLPETEAARVAAAGFGDPAEVAAGFGGELAAAQARRVGLVLMVSGPLVGMAWLAALGSSPGLLLRGELAGPWAAGALYPLILAVAVPAALLALAVTGRLSRWLPATPRVAPTAAAVAASACLLGDLVLLTLLALATAVPGPALAWPVVVAVAASMVRLAFGCVELRSLC